MFNPFKKLLDDNERSVNETVEEAADSVDWSMIDGGRGGGGKRGGGRRVSQNRESHFNRKSGRFHDPDTGAFEPGRPPSDLDQSTDRYRAKNGRFKKRSSDLYDERDEVEFDGLWPED